MTALVVRTQRPYFKSRPGRLLLVTTAAVTAVVAAIAVSYVLVTELAKRRFYRAADGTSVT